MKSTRQEVELITTRASFPGLIQRVTASVLLQVEAILLQATLNIAHCLITTSTLTEPIYIYVEPSSSPWFIYEALFNIPPPNYNYNLVHTKASTDATCALDAFVF
jgi:hypothetical protein